MTFLYNDNKVDTSTLKFKLLKPGKHCHIKIIDKNECVVHIDIKDHGYDFQYNYDIIRHEDDMIEIDCKFNGGILLKCHAGLRDVDEPRMKIVKRDYYPEILLSHDNNADTQKHFYRAIDKININIMYLLLTDEHFSNWR
jgi:hypothetical protein